MKKISILHIHLKMIIKFLLLVMMFLSCKKSKKQDQPHFIFPSIIKNLNNEELEVIKRNRYKVLLTFGFKEVNVNDTITFTKEMKIYKNFDKELGSYNTNRKIKINSTKYNAYISVFNNKNIIINRSFFNKDSIYIEENFFLKKISLAKSQNSTSLDNSEW